MAADQTSAGPTPLAGSGRRRPREAANKGSWCLHAAQGRLARKDKQVVSKYDPFARGSFPVGVRTVEARDGARSRLFPVEIWYPAAAQHAGQDLTPETQDVFAIPAHDAPRRQMAERNPATQPGTYPLIVFSHGSASVARRLSTFVGSHLCSHVNAYAAK